MKPKIDSNLWYTTQYVLKKEECTKLLKVPRGCICATSKKVKSYASR